MTPPPLTRKPKAASSFRIAGFQIQRIPLPAPPLHAGSLSPPVHRPSINTDPPPSSSIESKASLPALAEKPQRKYNLLQLWAMTRSWCHLCLRPEWFGQKHIPVWVGVKGHHVRTIAAVADYHQAGKRPDTRRGWIKKSIAPTLHYIYTKVQIQL